MEWFENEEIALTAEAIGQFASNEIEGKVVDLESLERPEFPRAALDRLGDLGFLWGPAPEEIGNAMDELTCAVILSELARTSAGFAATIAVHFSALRALLALPDGDAVIREAFAGRGVRLFGVALERDVIPLARSQGTTELLAIPAPHHVDEVVCCVGDSLIVSSASGLSGHPGASVNLSGCEEMPVARLELPAGGVIGVQTAQGPPAACARGAMVSSLKLYFSAIMQGVARDATEYALDYTRQRRQTGRAIYFHQNVCKKLVEMEVANQAMASFLYRTAAGAGNGASFGLVDLLYAFVKDSCEHVVSEAMQSLGGYGYIREYGIEKKLRDIKTLQALLPSNLTDWVAARA